MNGLEEGGARHGGEQGSGRRSPGSWRTRACGSDSPRAPEPISASTARWRSCDVREPGAIATFADEVAERFKGIDIVVVNAGVGSYGPFLELREEEMEEIVDVNVKGTLHTLRAALPHLPQRDEADVVTIASEAGRRGLPFEAVYCASKFAQVGLRPRSTTSSGRTGSAARTCALAASRPSSRWVAAHARHARAQGG